MAAPTLGILTGISYVSGLDYFKGINEKVLAGTPHGHLMSPNPDIVMVSVTFRGQRKNARRASGMEIIAR